MKVHDNISLKSLFLLFFKIGGMTLGGGYAMMPVMHDEIVDIRGWISADEFVDILAIAQSFPGALAVNAAIYVGYRLRGKKGALASCLGVILPPFIIIILASAFLIRYRDTKMVQHFFAGVRPAVSALIAVAVMRLFSSVDKNLISISLAMISFIAVVFIKIHPALIIIMAAIFGVVFLTQRVVNIDNVDVVDADTGDIDTVGIDIIAIDTDDGSTTDNLVVKSGDKDENID